MEDQEIFVGRSQKLDILDNSLLTLPNRGTPIVVSGMAGIGKTALLRHWFNKQRFTVEPAWFSFLGNLSRVGLSELFTQIKLRASILQAETKPEIVSVVIDDTNELSRSNIITIVDELYRSQYVVQVYIIRKEGLFVRGWTEISVGELSYESARALIRELQNRVLSEDQIAKAISLASGSPILLNFLRKSLTAGNADQLLSADGLPVYELSSTIHIPSQQIIQVIKPEIITAGESLIDTLKRQPKDVFKLSARDFELFLADLLRVTGWDVEVTKQTRDGGADIFAYLNTSVGRLLCLVEAKHYREDRKVGVDLVSTLYGTLFDKQANSAMMVTSSSFTRDAHEFQKRHQYQLSLRDYVDVVNWILQFGKDNGGGKKM